MKNETNLSESDSRSGNDKDRKRPAKRTSDETATNRNSDDIFGTQTSHIDLLSPTSLETGDNEGFIPVPAQKRVRDKPKDINPKDIIPKTVVMLLTTKYADPPIIDLLTPSRTDDTPRPFDHSPLSKPSRSEH